MVSRADLLHGHIRKRLEALGFDDVTVTGAALDGLSMLIDELKPRVVLMGSMFYLCATPYMMADLHKQFPKQNFAAISVTSFPAERAKDFIINGARSYVNLWEGPEQFYEGLENIREGREYISPEVQRHMDGLKTFPEPSKELTAVQTEITRFLANGFKGREIADVMGISERTVDTHKTNIFAALKARNETELIRMALFLGIIKPDELNLYGDNWAANHKPRKKANAQKTQRRIT
ncbi:MAG: response regulator transcription factor [Treponema sp.]|nr:response regulator transcription factor [Treponema sp.]